MSGLLGRGMGGDIMARTRKPVRYMGRLVINPLTRGEQRRKRRRILRAEQAGSHLKGTLSADAALVATSGLELRAAVLDAAEHAYGRHLLHDYGKTLASLSFTVNQTGMLINRMAAYLGRLRPPIHVGTEGAFKDPAEPTLTYQAFISKLKKDGTLADVVAAVIRLAE